MSRAWLWIGGGIAALVLVGAGVGGYLLWRLDPRAELERQLEAATGRDVTIAGPVALSFFPTLGVTAADVSLANMPGGTAPQMVSAKQIRIGVAAQPLMDRKLVVRSLILSEPTIALEVAKDGTANWVFPALSPRPGAPAQDPLKDLKDVSFGDVRVERGTLSFYDAATDQRYDLADIDARVRLDSLNEPLTIAGSAAHGGEHMDVELRFGEARRLFTGGQTSLVANLAAAPLQARFEGVLAAGGGELEGAVDASGSSLRRAVALFADPIGEGPGLEKFALKGRLTFSAEEARFDDALFSLDRANGRGALKLDFAAERPELTGRVQIASLDLNPYLPAPEPGVSAGAAPSVDASTAGWDKKPLDLSGLRGIDARIAVTTGPVAFQKMKIDSARGAVTLKDGVMVVNLEDAALYGGSTEGALTIDARGDGLALKQDLIFNSVQAEALLKDAIGLDAVEGEGQLVVTLSGDGASQDALMRSLDGQVTFRLADGALKGVNLSGVATTISRAIRGEFVGPQARTKFSGFTATFTLADGVAATRDLRLRSADAEITASGTIDVGAQALDLRIVPKVENFVSRMGVPGTRIAVPFRVTGSWLKPDYRTDLAASARAQVESQVRQVETRAADRLREAASNFLRPKPAEAAPAPAPAQP